MKYILLVIIISCCCGVVVSQNSKKERANLIISQAKKELIKIKETVDNIYLEASSKYSARKEKIKEGYIPNFGFTTKLWQKLPNQIKFSILNNYSNGASQLTEQIVSEKSLSTKMSSKLPGGNGFIPLAAFYPGDQQKNQEIELNKIRYETFCYGFLIFLLSSEQLDFEFLGVAKSNEQRADVISTSIADTYKIHLFFNQENHQLLLITAKFIEPRNEENIEQKYFFSDYKEECGISFAHKIVIQENEEVVEEREIKKIEINPKLEADFFATKM